MDPGTDALDMIHGRIIPLRRGYVAVVNRSQADIKANLSIRESLRKETAFFVNHPSYRSMSNKCGSQYLSKNLNTVLMHHIRDCLPDLKNKARRESAAVVCGVWCVRAYTVKRGVLCVCVCVCRVCVCACFVCACAYDLCESVCVRAHMCVKGFINRPLTSKPLSLNSN